MKLDTVTVRDPVRYFEKAARAHYQAKDGYDMTALPIGVLVKRLPDCSVAIDRDEPEVVLIPWAQVASPCGVSKVQPK